MYKLIIGNSRSANFQRAVKMAEFLGGSYDGNKIELVVHEDMKAYETLFPLFRLNVFKWKQTRAYHNGKKVNPYKFMFKMDQKRKTFFADVLEQLDDEDLGLFELISKDHIPQPFLYHKREGNKFFFQGEGKKFHLIFTGKRLYEFIDKHDIGDLIYFE